MDFESQLKDKTVPIAIDFDKKKFVLLITFGGMALNRGFPIFEFNKITNGLKSINKIHLRDRHKWWYHRGLDGVGDNIEDIAIFLRQYTTDPSTQKVVVFGNSVGGYAALLFGYILKADVIHAFVPKTFINPVKRYMCNDPLPSGQFFSLYYFKFWFSLFTHCQRNFFDLKKVFKKIENNKSKFHIHYPSKSKKDCLHALRMKSIPNFYFHQYEYDRHNLIRFLRKKGLLKEIIDQAILIQN